MRATLRGLELPSRMMRLTSAVSVSVIATEQEVSAWQHIGTFGVVHGAPFPPARSAFVIVSA